MSNSIKRYLTFPHKFFPAACLPISERFRLGRKNGTLFSVYIRFPRIFKGCQVFSIRTTCSNLDTNTPLNPTKNFTSCVQARAHGVLEWIFFSRPDRARVDATSSIRTSNLKLHQYELQT